MYCQKWGIDNELKLLLKECERHILDEWSLGDIRENYE